MYSSMTVAGAALFGIVFAVTNLLARIADQDIAHDIVAPADRDLPPAA